MSGTPSIEAASRPHGAPTAPALPVTSPESLSPAQVAQAALDGYEHGLPSGQAAPDELEQRSQGLAAPQSRRLQRASHPVPSRLDPSGLVRELPFPTQLAGRNLLDEGDFVPPVVHNAAGNRLTLEEIRDNIRNHADPAGAIAWLGRRGSDPFYSYLTYNGLSDARPTIRDVHAQGGAECDGIMSVQAYMLEASGVAVEGSVAVAQVMAYGGWHNVVVYRDALSGQFTVMDYHRIVSIPQANSREEALVHYFNGNSGVAVLYRITDPDDRPTALYHVRSRHNATVTGFGFAPGVGQAMAGTFGVVRGLNDSNAPARPIAGGWNARAEVMTESGVRAEAEMRSAGLGIPDRFGAGVLVPVGSESAIGGKALFYRNPTTGDMAVFAAGEWWRVRGDSFVGIVAGVDARIENLDRQGEPISSVAPMVAVSGGHTHTLFENDTVALSAYWNAYGALAAPLVLGEEARERVEDASNGVSPEGWLEPGGLVSSSTLGSNVGARLRLNFSDAWSGHMDVAGRAVLTDPTLAPVSLGSVPVPFRGSLEARASVRYQSSSTGLELGASGSVGSLFHRDARWSAYGSVAQRAGESVQLDLSLIGGQFVNGQAFGSAQAGITAVPSEHVRLRLGAGVSVIGSDNGSPTWIPHLGLQGEF